MSHTAISSNLPPAPATARHAYGQGARSGAAIAPPATAPTMAIMRLRARLHDCLIDLIAECDDAGAAVEEGRLERALGGPSLALEALHAHLAERKAAVAALRAQIAQLEAA